MEQIKIVTERSSDSYSAYADNVPGIYGQGDTLEEARHAALAGIELLKKYNSEDNTPSILKGDYEIVFEDEGSNRKDSE